MRYLVGMFLLWFSSLVFACEPAKDASRIAVAGGSITEVIYFLGEEQRIVAADRTSNYPEEATSLPSVGYVRDLSAEGILSLKPSLVLGEQDMGPIEVLDQLRATSVEVRRLDESSTARGVVRKVMCIAAILGVEEKAERLIAEKLSADIATLDGIAESNHRKPPVALLLMFSEGSPIIAGKQTSGDGVLTMAGAANVFDMVDGWKPVSLEAMVSANPQHIVITDRGFGAAGGLEGLKKNPALRLTDAVRRNQVHVIDGMALLGFGPRTLTTAIELAESMQTER